MRYRLTADLDFKETPQGLNPQPALWAVHNRTSEKYFLSKSISLYTVNNDEYVGLYGCTDKIKKTDIEAVFEQFKRLISELPTDEKHMSSIFTAALISEEEIDPKWNFSSLVDLDKSILPLRAGGGFHVIKSAS